MFTRTVFGAMVLTLVTTAQAAEAGYYSSIDTRDETRYSRNYDTFREVLDVLSTIGVDKPITNPPIRRRYLFIEALGADGSVKLGTLQEKLNYSSVLIRRRPKEPDGVRFLEPVFEAHRNNFLVLAQFAAAHYLTNNSDYESKAINLMDRALKKWPKTWEEVPEDQQKLLKSMGWEGAIDFDRYRRCEELFQRLIIHRLNEKKPPAKKERPVETLDPLFLNGAKPILFVNDKGEYEAGRIAKADKDQLRRDCVEDIEQLLIWMPTDKRLLWLLAETLNASAMDESSQLEKSKLIHSAYKIFERLTNFEDPERYAREEIANRKEVLRVYVAANPLDVIAMPDEDPNDVKMTSFQWYRTLAIAFSVGLAIGVFALWQLQELRRRRAARTAAKA